MFAARMAGQTVMSCLRCWVSRPSRPHTGPSGLCYVGWRQLKEPCENMTDGSLPTPSWPTRKMTLGVWKMSVDMFFFSPGSGDGVVGKREVACWLRAPLPVKNILFRGRAAGVLINACACTLSVCIIKSPQPIWISHVLRCGGKWFVYRTRTVSARDGWQEGDECTEWRRQPDLLSLSSIHLLIPYSIILDSRHLL